jgi:tripartite-type tricarboxylate transporter receptor subunit TctC
MSIKFLRTLLSVISAALLLGGAVRAADFPSKAVQLVVPYGAGPSDVLARITAACLSTHLKQSVIVLNKPGANATLGANFVKTAAPDGHTVLLAASATVTDLVTTREPTLDVRQDLEPITKAVFGIQGVYVNTSLPVHNIADLVEHAKANPGKLNYATTGIGSVNHLSTEALALTTGINMVHIPYAQGTGPLLTALMSGEVQVVLTDVGGAQAALDSGKVRLIAVLTKERAPSRPNIPTVIESLPAMAIYTGTLWYGFFAPPKTPKDIVQRLHSELTACLNDPQVRASIKKLGYEDNQFVANTPDQFRASILEDVSRLKEVVQKANIALR